MVNKNKTKGKTFENQICKIMETIFGGSFMRCFGSGAYVGGANVVRMQKLSESQILNTRGDIVPDDSMPNLIIECKSYKDFPFNLLSDNKSIAVMDKWLAQVETDVLNNEFYFLTFKINNKGIFGVFRQDLITDCEVIGNYSIYNYNNKKYIICNLEEFLKNNKNKIKQKTKK